MKKENKKKVKVKKIEKIKEETKKMGKGDDKKDIGSIVKKTLIWITGSLLFLIILVFGYFNMPVKNYSQDAKMGVTFSYLYAEQIGLDWKQVYMAMLEDLEIKNIRIPVYWDRVEQSEGNYDFSALDWQLEKAAEYDAKVILVVGQKVPRWPECYVPKWVGEDPGNLDQQRLREKLLGFQKTVIEKYKDNPAISRWQIENEPFLAFGICSTVNEDLLDAELKQARELDSRPIVVTDSGELSLWVKAASRADIFGTTMYREVYSEKMGHWRYPIGPNFFKFKQWMIKEFADQENAIVIELQGEPWVKGWTVDQPLDVQLDSMNAGILEENMQFAQKTGMKEIYLWGVEWWYWMKVKQDNSTLWETAKKFSVKDLN